MKKYVDEYLPIALLYALSIYFLTDTKDVSEASQMYPGGLSWILIGLTTILLIGTLMKKIKLPVDKTEVVSFKFKVIFFASVFYVAAVPFLGFVVSSLIFCPVTALLLGYKRKVLLLVVSVVTVGLIYYIFKVLLSVPLPTLTVFGLTL